MAAVYIHRRCQAAQQLLNYRRYRRQQRDQQDPFDLPDADFAVYFRMSKEICQEFINIVQPHMRKQSHGLTARIKILSAIRFFSSGSYQFSVGQDCFINLSQPSVSRNVREVAKAISTHLTERYIHFPEENERSETKRRFYEMYGMPGVIGVVDGTHILIKKPNINIEHVYYAVRKSAHTKNVQVICDFNLKIIGLNAGYGGSSHDSFIFENSAIQGILRSEYERGTRNSYLLGDSGYAQKPWLMTPFGRPNGQTRAEERYNCCHQKARHRVERCIGVLKSRFRCLSRQRYLLYSPAVAGNIINSCVVLHNIMVEKKYPLPTEDDINANVDIPNIEINTNVNNRDAGFRAREALISAYFN